MTNLVMLFICPVPGMLLRVGRRVPANAHAAINGFIVPVALPALILGQIHGLRLNAELVWPLGLGLIRRRSMLRRNNKP